MIMKRLFFLLSALFLGASALWSGSLVSVNGTTFQRDGIPYHYVGANFWYGALLGADKANGGQARLAQELDALQEAGISNLRISLGRSCLDSLSVSEDSLLAGLDFLLQEMGKRDMTAVVCLTDSAEDGGRFRPFVAALLKRTNSFTGQPYASDPVVMAWELAEKLSPGQGESPNELVGRLSGMAAWIKSIDGRHLVAAGCAGSFDFPKGELAYEQLLNDVNIDYVTLHFRPFEWNWVARGRAFEDLPNVYLQAEAYLNKEERFALKAGKPLVIEAFSYPRDHFFKSPSSKAEYRTAFFRFVLERVVRSKRNGGVLAGCNFYGWGGHGRFVSQDWQPGNEYLAEKPDEAQGTYSVYATDSTAVQLFKASAAALKQ